MINHKTGFATIVLVMAAFFVACSSEPATGQDNKDLTEAEMNLVRSMELVDAAVQNYFSVESMSMARYYNPYTKEQSDERGSVWMYTSAFEAVNAILTALKTQCDSGDTEMYDKYYKKYCDLLDRLFEGLQYYKGTFNLVSYTQTREWSVYAVDRAGAPGAANVSGILNVYDDQQWLAREFIESYYLTGSEKFLAEAEYLAEYILDGWDLYS